MRVKKKEPHYVSEIKNERYELEDNKWVLKMEGLFSYREVVYEDAYNKDGKFLREIQIAENIHREYLEKCFEKELYVIQINYDFHLLPKAGAYTMDEIYRLADLLNVSIDGEFKAEEEHRHKYNGANYEMSSIGHSRHVYHKTKKVNKKVYTSNYKKALDKYPKHEYMIKRLYKFNCYKNNWKVKD